MLCIAYQDRLFGGFVLSYQHSFHAGNHADVLKHLTLMSVLQKLNIKSKPYFYLDTHAGAGVYDLNSKEAKLNAEAESGVLQLTSLEPASPATNQSNISDKGLLFETYISLVNDYAQHGQYPGSPMIAASLLRSMDKGFAAELNTTVFESLEYQCRRSGLKAQHRDGFEMLNAMLPPAQKRGAVLIDPPYESKDEYQQVVNSLLKAVKRWPSGIYMVWYPLLSSTRLDRKTGAVVNNPKAHMTQAMLQMLAELAVKSVLNIQFCAQSPSETVGMYGSGICILNPPWQLESDLQQINKVLGDSLTSDNNKLSTVEWLKVE